jgi:hypothetical protein
MQLTNVETLRKNRKGATAIFTLFTRMKDKYHNSIFCCFEGDDAKYYFKRIEDNTLHNPENIIVLNCEGKTEVLRLYHLIKSKTEYKSIKFLYFIDRDFDAPKDASLTEIYETPCYSVENFYTTEEAFIRIVKCEFNYNETDDEYLWLLNMFKIRQADFHAKTIYLNAWIACQRDISATDNTKRLNMSNFNIQKIIPNINLDAIEAEYDNLKLKALFPEAADVSEEKFHEKIRDFSSKNLQQTFRGKFEIDFLFSILESVKAEFNCIKPRLRKKSGVQLNQSKKNMISEFSHYATTESGLVKYLLPFKKQEVI